MIRPIRLSIVAIMLLIGVLNAGKISDYQLDKNEKYNKAIKIESQETIMIESLKVYSNSTKKVGFWPRAKKWRKS